MKRTKPLAIRRSRRRTRGVSVAAAGLSPAGRWAHVGPVRNQVQLHGQHLLFGIAPSYLWKFLK
jgi:hypothetical protein